MTQMFDCDGKKVYEGELVYIIDCPDLFPKEYWAVFDYLEYGIYKEFVLKNCTTNDIKILPQRCIKRSY